MNTIFVTGATGFIGKNLIELLLEKGERIVALSTHNQSDIDILKKYHIKDIIFEEDLALQNEYQIDYCVHLASYGVRFGDADINTMIDVNIKLAAKVMLFCNNNGCKTFLSAPAEHYWHNLFFV